MADVELRPREYCELARRATRGKRRVSHKAHGSIEWLHDRLWDAMIAADPEPVDFEAVLWELALNLDPANGPAKALANEIITDWRWARNSSAYTTWLRNLRERGADPRPEFTPRPFIDRDGAIDAPGATPGRDGLEA